MRFFSLIILLLCCASPSVVAQEKKTLRQEVQEFAEAVRKHLKRQEVAFTEEAKATREVVKKMSADVTAQSKLVNKLSAAVTAQSKQMQALQAKFEELQRELTKVTLENAKLRQAIAVESQIRTKNDKKIVEEITRAMGKTTIPDSTPPQPTPKARHYVVRKGDTLSAIAQAFKTSVGNLKRANNLTDASKIRVGQKLVIPE